MARYDREETREKPSSLVEPALVAALMVLLVIAICIGLEILR